MNRTKPARLVEGVDYYIESGKFVFTAAYHLKRGYCCNSKCRHCPYGRDGGLGTRIELAGLPIKMGGLKRPIGGG
ncbi:MAG: DUF5522 domain-containing protein [Minicystis sp.]